MPIIRLKRTVSLVRALYSFGGARPRARAMPRQKQPDAIREGYYRALLPEVAVAQAAFAQVGPQIVALLAAERRAQGHKDGDSAGKQKAKALIAQAAKRAAAAFSPTSVYAAAEAYANRTSDFNKEQLGRQVSAALSIKPSTIELGIKPQLEEFAARNVDLIKTVPDRFFDRIRLDVEDAFDSGMHPDTLADQFEDRYGMAEDDARRIARDQIGKLNGQLNQERQERLGVTGYTWRTMNDERVRDEHSEREGEHFDWDDPPEDGHPGEAIQCRCFAEPDFSEILDEL